MCQQVKFIDLNAPSEDQEELYGILIDDKVICACCGGIFAMDEIEILEKYTNWADFSKRIGE